MVQAIGRKIGIAVGLQGSKADLGVLQKIVDSDSIAVDKTRELQSLGVVLGDIFALHTELHWVIVEDEYGRDPALRFRETKNLVFPLTMISKRIEDARPVQVESIFDGVLEYVEEFK